MNQGINLIPRSNKNLVIFFIQYFGGKTDRPFKLSSNYLLNIMRNVKCDKFTVIIIIWYFKLILFVTEND